MNRKTEYDASLDPVYEQEAYYHSSRRQACYECGRVLSASAVSGDLCARCESETEEEVWS